MLGQIVYRAGRGGGLRPEAVELMGLRVLRVGLDPDSFWYGQRLGRAIKLLRRAGAGRVLVPEGFSRWESLERHGLRGVDPIPFLSAHAGALAVAALERREARPDRSAVALRGERETRDMVLAAHALSGQVREVCISVPGGGERLEAALRREYGMAVRPDYPQIPAAVRFDDGTDARGGAVLSLFGPRPELAGVEIGLREGRLPEDTQPLPLLSALWEAGLAGARTLEFT